MHLCAVFFQHIWAAFTTNLSSSNIRPDRTYETFKFHVYAYLHFQLFLQNILEIDFDELFSKA